MKTDCGHQEHEGCGCGERHHEQHSPDAGAERCGCGRHEHRPGGGRHGHHPGCGCGRSAASDGAPWRRFATREEIIARLDKYLQELRAEAQAVEEKLAELRAK